jgi:inosine-uridine nucleoside N-ribohydrolase
MKSARILLALAALAVLFAVSFGARGQQLAAASQPAATPDLVILDTDIGDDIDDAFALALALRSPELKLIGVTTTYGDTELRARLVTRYLGSLCRFEINVMPGLPTPHPNSFTQAAYANGSANTSCSTFRAHAVGKADQARQKEDAAEWKADQAVWMAGVAHLVQQRAAHDAAGFLLDRIRESPGQVTLIAIGPLFNVQAAIERDPASFRKLKRVVMMGGSIYRGYDGQKGEHRPPDPEWNIDRDPAGLKALLASGVPIYMMPLDSTQIHLEAREREQIFAHGSALTDQLTLLYHQWMAGNESHSPAPTLFDPVAVAYAVRPELCPMTPMRIEVDEKGFTKPVAGEPNVQVCLQSDEKGFLEFLLGRITKDAGR